MGVDVAIADRAWRFIYSTTMRGLGEPCVSPVGQLGELRCQCVLVCIAEADPMRESRRLYWEALRPGGFGGRAKLLETKGEGHVFHQSRPHCAEAEEMMECLVAFISGELHDESTQSSQ
ncbi:putative carboxylesterase 2 [Wolffia australiana]